MGMHNQGTAGLQVGHVFFLFFFCLSAHCLHMADRLWADGSGFFMTCPNSFYNTAPTSSFVLQEKRKKPGIFQKG